MSNPLLNDSVFRDAAKTSEAMTISGTINKSIILWALLAVSAIYAWTHPHISAGLVYPALILGFVLALVTIFKKPYAPILSPLYALCQGMLLGYLSLVFERQYPGIVVNAVFLTIAVLFCMLTAYRAGLLKATPMFYKVVIFSTFSILIVYILDLLLNLFGGGGIPYLHQSSMLGIGISLVIVGVASLNLIIDFDIIEKSARFGAPKYMEWYGAFALMVTLVWLYLEMLRLLGKIRN
ncbi:MAG: Bax inhibitor-1/YccA family protein [Endomicrobia bacterium]|nr:Bax inhibitor-1/YccA family protein [Endomicrobiia bacterium]MCL2507146.1 Bax inhibitor-1/YccA family protein [Endomicrobiia bacterium]